MNLVDDMKSLAATPELEGVLLRHISNGRIDKTAWRRAS